MGPDRPIGWRRAPQEARPRCSLQQIHQPQKVNGQRVPALRSTDPRVLVLWSALVMFRLLPSGFASRDFRRELAALSGEPPATMTPGRVSYDLRRLVDLSTISQYLGVGTSGREQVKYEMLGGG